MKSQLLPSSPASASQQRAALLAALTAWPDAASDEDAARITSTLGRSPQGQWRVIVRDARQRPRVLATYPLFVEAGRCLPFPNTLWLVCPKLIHKLSDLERTGGIAQIQHHLHNSPRQMAKLAADHAHFAAWRWAMLTETDRQYAQSLGWQEALAQRGIGGITPGSVKIKCLHAHAAYHLAFAPHLPDAGVVGRLALTMLRKDSEREQQDRRDAPPTEDGASAQASL